MKNKVVYLGLAVDLIHPGHLNIINEGKKLVNLVNNLEQFIWYKPKKNAPNKGIIE